METERSFVLSIDKLLGPNLRIILFPFLAIAALIILIFIVANTGYSRISSRLEELQGVQKDEAVLEQKLEILREIEEGILAQSDVSLIAMPDKNPALWMVGQLNGVAAPNSVYLFENKLRSESKDDSGLSNIEFETSVRGGQAQILNFLKAINSLAPISTIESVNLEEDKGTLVAELKIKVYWADLPTKLPPLTTPVKRLTTQEEELLANIARLQRPTFTILPPSQPSERQSPFD